MPLSIKLPLSDYLTAAEITIRRLQKGMRPVFEQGEHFFPTELEIETKTFVQELKRAIESGVYEAQSPLAYWAELDKKRLLFRYAFSEQVLHTLVARRLNQTARFSTHLYSYQKGISRKQALDKFAKYLKAHRRKNIDKKKRGFYILRCDVEKYTDSIPLDSESLLWKVLPADSAVSVETLRTLLTSEVVSKGGGSWNPLRGLPTGSPLTPVLANLYLAPLDERMALIPGAFYARFGDDILMAHEDEMALVRAEEELKKILSRFRLSANSGKYRAFFFSGSGAKRHSNREWAGAQYVTYLGLNIDFCGAVSIPAPKMKLFFRRQKRNLWAARNLFSQLDGLDLGKSLCRVVNENMDYRSPVADPLSSDLRGIVTDRRQLHFVDYWFALRISELCAKRKGARAFRGISWKALRHNGLTSLVGDRNA